MSTVRQINTQNTYTKHTHTKTHPLCAFAIQRTRSTLSFAQVMINTVIYHKIISSLRQKRWNETNRDENMKKRTREERESSNFEYVVWINLVRTDWMEHHLYAYTQTNIKTHQMKTNRTEQRAQLHTSFIQKCFHLYGFLIHDEWDIVTIHCICWQKPSWKLTPKNGNKVT